MCLCIPKKKAWMGHQLPESRDLRPADFMPEAQANPQHLDTEKMLNEGNSTETLLPGFKSSGNKEKSVSKYSWCNRDHCVGTSRKKQLVGKLF